MTQKNSKKISMKMKFKRPKLYLGDFLDLQSFIFDESCVCHDNFDHYCTCCGKKRPLHVNVMYFNWDKRVKKVRFKDVLDSVQEVILKFYYKELFLRRISYFDHYQKYIKIRKK